MCARVCVCFRSHLSDDASDGPLCVILEVKQKHDSDVIIAGNYVQNVRAPEKNTCNGEGEERRMEQERRGEREDGMEERRGMGDQGQRGHQKRNVSRVSK